MEFRILGPFEVLDHGRDLTPARAKQRTLLAMLVLHANDVVARDQLIEGLWGDAPPGTAHTVVHGHVSALRKLLGPDRIETRGPGYLLRASSDELDLAHFEALVAEAQGHLDADARAARLRAALAVWRGEPLADFRYDSFAQSERARLDELKLSVLEERLDADLTRGRHGELIPELEQLVAKHPFRERLRGQLMLALYRSGRQAEALSAYHDARRALVEELGIEPGLALRQLEKAILAQEPLLEPPQTAPVPELLEVSTEKAVEPAAADTPTADERKLVTVVFADLAESTALSERLDPERVRVLLREFFAAMTSVVESFGGRVEKFIGDAVMAAFGVPSAQEDHAERALHAALAMQERLREHFDHELELRIGVNTGEAVVGPPLEGGSFVVGDCVNVAARLEQSAGPGEVLVGERTVAASRGAFEFEEPMTLEAKGKSGGVRCRRLVCALSLSRPRGLGGLGTAFVGREGEFEQLFDRYRRVADRSEPHLITIVGEAGVGKTRLVQEFLERLQREAPALLRRRGRCLSYGRAITYWPLGEILKEELGILDSDAPDVVRARLGDRDILGLALGLDVAAGLHPLAARDRFEDAWVDFLERLVAERPAVILVEDLHWAEDPLLDLLEGVLREVRGPLLLVATARPDLLDQRPGWSAHGGATLLRLEALAPDDATKMLAELLGTGLPARLREVVVERAEGNPLFIEELVAALLDRGLLERSNGGWALHELPEGAVVPDTVQAVLASRVDLLKPAEKEALQAAAVIGRVFWTGPIYELVAGLRPSLRVLEERDFIRRRSGSSMAGEREYEIKHALTREVAYASLPKARRARLHAAFARWLERAGEGRDGHTALLAHHYAQAVRPEDIDLVWAGEPQEVERLRAKSLVWLRQAAQLAIGRYEIDDALALLHRAVELAESDRERADLWAAIGRANVLKYDGEGFWTAMEKAGRHASDRPARAAIYSELAFHTSARAGMWKRRPDRDVVYRWIKQALDLAQPASVARLKALIARCFWDPAQSGEDAVEASDLGERLGDLELRSYAADARRLTAFAAGRFEEARAWAERRFEALDEIDDPDHIAVIYETAIPTYSALGRFDDARRLASMHDQVTSQLTHHHRLHGVARLLEVEELAGDWATIRGLEARTEEAVAANAATPCALAPSALLICAIASLHRGEDASARRLEQKVEGLGMEGYGPVLNTFHLRLALARGDLNTVERLCAQPIAPRGHTWHLFLSATAALLDGLAAIGDRERVEAEAPPLLGQTYLGAFASRALGTVRTDVGLVEQAAASFDAFGLDWHAAQTRAVLSAALQ
jgi:DNA-binding SARP family transcriptional activator